VRIILLKNTIAIKREKVAGISNTLLAKKQCIFFSYSSLFFNLAQNIVQMNREQLGLVTVSVQKIFLAHSNKRPVDCALNLFEY
jgi:hypothetical protein